MNFSEEYEGYRETVPAYTFTNKPRVTTVSPVDITQWPNQSQPNKGCEIGSNADVNAILKEIQ